jgi:hypothetical protein
VNPVQNRLLAYRKKIFLKVAHSILKSGSIKSFTPKDILWLKIALNAKDQWRRATVAAQTPQRGEIEEIRVRL